MITLEHIYILAGLMFGAFALLSVRDAANPRRAINAAFWGLLAASFLVGSELSDLANGVLVLGLIVLGAIGLGRGSLHTTTQDQRRASAVRLGNWLFVPALIVPAVALLGERRVEVAGAQARFQVDHRDLAPERREGAGERRGGVALDNDG